MTQAHLAHVDAALIALLTATWAHPVSAQSTKLSGPLAGPGSDVVEFAVDPDGTHVFYVADQDVAGVRELFTVPIDGSSPPLQLSGPLPASGDVVSFLVGPAGWVVYRADANVDESFELFGVPSDGSEPAVQLNPPLVAGGVVWNCTLSSDGTLVVYLADQDTDDVFELFAVPVDGSAPAQRLHPPFAQEAALECHIDPTGAFVVYSRVRYTPQFLEIFEAFSVPIDASAPPALLGSYSCFCSITHWLGGFVFSPDGQWVSYVRDFDNGVDRHEDLFLAPADGSAPAIELPTSQYCSSVTFTPDGARMVYGIAHDYSWSQDDPQLVSSTLAGAASYLDEGEAGFGGAWQLDPASGTVFFGQPSGVYRVPADGSASQTLISQSEPNTAFQPALALSPDGNRVVFVVEDEDGARALRSVPSTGGTTLTLSSAPSADLGETLIVTPDSRSVVYVVETGPSVEELFVVPIHGTRPPRRVNDALPAGGTVFVPNFVSAQNRPAILADGSLAYLASEDTSGVFELYKASLAHRRLALRAPGATGPVSR